MALFTKRLIGRVSEQECVCRGVEFPFGLMNLRAIVLGFSLSFLKTERGTYG